MNKVSEQFLQELAERYPLGINPVNYCPRTKGVSMHNVRALRRAGYLSESGAGIFTLTEKGLEHTQKSGGGK